MPLAKLYPYDNWFIRKRPYTLIKGKDYNCQPHSMGQQIRNAAHERGLRVSIRIEGKILFVTNLGKV